MFSVAKCPICEKLVEPAHEQSVYVIINGRSCKTVSYDEAVKSYQADKNVIICEIHELHYEAFKVMVEAGEYPPN